MTYEDGYQWIQNYLSSHFDQIVDLMLEEENPDIRSKLVELIGDADKREGIEYLKRELESSHLKVREWAHASLKHSELKEANRIAEEFEQANPNEAFL